MKTLIHFNEKVGHRTRTNRKTDGCRVKCQRVERNISVKMDKKRCMKVLNYHTATINHGKHSLPYSLSHPPTGLEAPPPPLTNKWKKTAKRKLNLFKHRQEMVKGPNRQESKLYQGTTNEQKTPRSTPRIYTDLKRKLQ